MSQPGIENTSAVLMPLHDLERACVNRPENRRGSSSIFYARHMVRELLLSVGRQPTAGEAMMHVAGIGARLPEVDKELVKRERELFVRNERTLVHTFMTEKRLARMTPANAAEIRAFLLLTEREIKIRVKKQHRWSFLNAVQDAAVMSWTATEHSPDRAAWRRAVDALEAQNESDFFQAHLKLLREMFVGRTLPKVFLETIARPQVQTCAQLRVCINELAYGCQLVAEAYGLPWLKDCLCSDSSDIDAYRGSLSALRQDPTMRIESRYEREITDLKKRIQANTEQGTEDILGVDLKVLAGLVVLESDAGFALEREACIRFLQELGVDILADAKLVTERTVKYGNQAGTMGVWYLYPTKLGTTVAVIYGKYGLTQILVVLRGDLAQAKATILREVSYESAEQSENRMWHNQLKPADASAGTNPFVRIALGHRPALESHLAENAAIAAYIQAQTNARG